MIHSLYLRLVLTFITVVIISLFASFKLADLFFHKDVMQGMQTQISDVGNQAVQLYPFHQKIDYDKYLQQLAQQNEVRVSLYNQTGLVKSYQTVGVHEPPPVNPQIVQDVLHGTEYEGLNNSQDDSNPGNIVVGIPFSYEKQEFAMILQPSGSKRVEEFAYFLKVTLLIVLIIGSLLILIVSRYLVTPIVVMTDATKRLAKGDFRVRLGIRRKDELGLLAENFNEMTRQLDQIEIMRRDFVSNVSHEIQSPLTSIRGFSKALLEDIDPLDRKYRFAEIIYNESTRLSRLSSNLLQLASLESENHPFQPVTYSLDEQIRRVVVALEPQWSEKELEIQLELPALEIQGDEDQLVQVWTNILTNSIKYSNPHGSIVVELVSDSESITVSVADQGIGIPREEVPSIFDRFYKVDKSRERIKSGSGLGLAIVKKIVEIHHGQIHVESELGTGTTFTVTLPRYQLYGSER